MLIKQHDLEQDVTKTGVLEAFKNSAIDVSDLAIRDVNEDNNMLLVQTDDQLYHVMHVELETRSNKKLYVTKHEVMRTYNGRNMQDHRTDIDDFPPAQLTEELLSYPDVVAHFMMMTHGIDQEWTSQILGIDADHKMMLVFDPYLGKALEVRFIQVDNELFVHGLPAVYWDWIPSK